MKKYRVEYSRNSAHWLKKIDRALFDKIEKKYIPTISDNPKSAGKRLSGVLKDFWSYHFHFSGTQYRIIYQIFEKEIIVVVVAIDKREKIYGRIQRKI